MEKIVHDILKSARELIAKGWTKGSFAKDTEGNPVPPESETAVCFCSLGALCKSYRINNSSYGMFREAVDELLKFTSPITAISIWNNSCNNVEEVLAVFDKALAQPIED